MPTVPTSDALPYAPVSGSLPNVQATAADFGGQVGGAEQKVGADLQQSSNELGNVALQIKEKQRFIATNDQTNNLMTAGRNITNGDPSNPNDPGYFGLKGQDAVNGRAAASKALNDAFTSGMSALQNDPIGQARFQADGRRYLNMFQGAIDGHYQQQMDVSQKQTAAASIDLNQQGLNNYAADENGFNTHLAGLQSSIYNHAATNGATDQVARWQVQQATQEAYVNRVDTLIAQGHPDLAQSVLKQYGSDIPATQNERLTQKLQPLLDKQSGDAAAQKYFPLGVNNNEFSPLVDDAADRNGVPRPLARAVASQEGGPRSNVLQVIPTTAANPGYGMSPISSDAVADPAQNINFGMGYLAAKAKANGLDLSDPANWAKAGALYNGGGDPQYQQKIQQRLAGQGVNPAGGTASYAPPMPDVDKAVSGILADPDLTEGAKEHAITQVTRQARYQEAATASDRAALTSSLNDGIAALQAGHDFTWDESRIRADMKPADADSYIAELNHAKATGQAYTALQFAGPDEINTKLGAMRAGLSDPENYEQKAKDYANYAAAAEKRQKALTDDPASYIAADPVVQKAAAAMQPGDATSVENYVRTSLSEQARLGVPDSQQHVLSNTQAAALVSKIGSADPATADIGSMLTQEQKSYGRYWPKVMGDLVNAGLPGSYHILAAMTPDDPTRGDPQAAARTDFQVAIKQAASVGGVPKYRESLPAAEAKAVDAGVGNALSDFQATTRLNQDGAKLYTDVQNATKLLAYSYVQRDGIDGTAAVEKAAKAIIGDKYDFDGTMRTPKGQMSDMQDATAHLLDGLKPTELAPFPGSAGLTPEQRQTVELDAAKRGTWIPNADDSGLVLMGLRKSGYGVVRYASGQPVTVPFGSKAPQQAALPPAPVDAGTQVAEAAAERH